jgi:hypothetical protein
MFPQVPSGAGVAPAQPTRIESQVVSAPQGVTPVSLDPQAPRAAAPPVGLAGDTGIPVRRGLEVASDLRSGAQTALPVAGAAFNPAAILDADLQSLLQGLRAWGLANLLESQAPEQQNWPAGSTPLADTPQDALAQLRDSLGRSAMFAFHPRIASMLGEAERRSASERATSASTAPDAPTGSPSTPSEVANSLAANEAGQASDAGRTAPATPSNSPTLSIDQAQQGLQLLLQGRLRWEGELTPGVPAELERNDVWEEDPDRPGTLQRGTSVRVKVSLPDSGELVVVAQQIADRYTVALQPDARHLGRFDAAISDLQQALAPLTPNPVALTLQPPAPGSLSSS